LFGCVHGKGLYQVSTECNPPVPARKTMDTRSGYSGDVEAQFHRHTPERTRSSQSKCGTPFLPGVMDWPEEASAQRFVPQRAREFAVGQQERDESATGVGRIAKQHSAALQPHPSACGGNPK
jgi:hypothetical protein